MTTERSVRKAEVISSSEILPAIQKFTQEDRKKLERAGFVIYPLMGQSIKTERDAGKPFSSNWHQHYPQFEAMQCRLSEVAINPNQLFLLNSNKKTLNQQQEIVEVYSQSLQSKLNTNEIRAIIGEAPDYVALVFTHSNKLNERLFGKKYNYDYARTKTPINVNGYVAGVGHYNGNGLYINYWDANKGYTPLWATPLVVPDS